jgi:hypothetical protein
MSCHGENLEIIPLQTESTTEQRVEIVNTGIKSMPPYNWILSDGEAERLVKFMEAK